MEWAGRIDLLVNNAGANPLFAPAAELAEEAWKKTFEVNLKAAFHLSQLAYHAWLKSHGEVILNVSSGVPLQILFIDFDNRARISD
jgi:NAD(P)-dependent dehydrogenase (short-subunit alcohol dehydrogenase family)